MREHQGSLHSHPTSFVTMSGGGSAPWQWWPWTNGIWEEEAGRSSTTARAYTQKPWPKKKKQTKSYNYNVTNTC